MRNYQKQIILLLKFIITGGLAYFLFHEIQAMPGIESERLQQILGNLKWGYLFLALFAVLLSNVFGAAQWHILLLRQGIKMSYEEVARIYFMGLFFNNFMPGNVGGDIKRIADIRIESGEKLGAGFVATIFDRLFGLFFLNALALGVGFLFFIWDPAKSPYLLPSFGVFVGFCVVFAGLFSRRIGKAFEKVYIRWAPALVTAKIAGIRERFHLFRTPKLWLQVLIISALTQILRVSVHWLCGLAIGVDIPISWYFYFIPIVAVITAIPISIGGFGVREASAAYLFGLVGVLAMDSVIIQLFAYIVGLTVSLLGGLEFLFHRKANTKQTG